jgi:hypothetical protein
MTTFVRCASAKRPHAPAKGSGRLQRAIVRAFIATGADELSTVEINDWCFARRRRQISERHRYSVFRILREIADQVERVPPYGAWLWRLRPTTR